MLRLRYIEKNHYESRTIYYYSNSWQITLGLMNIVPISIILFGNTMIIKVKEK